MGKFCSYILSMVAILLFGPFLLTLFCQGSNVVSGKPHWRDEMALASWMTVQIEEDFPQEAMRSQAVVARSNYQTYQNMGGQDQVYEEIIETLENKKRRISYISKYLDCMEAVRSTEETLCYQGKVSLAPYHRASGGTTRDGVEVLHEEKYAYLISVDSSWDIKGEDYGNVFLIQREGLLDNLKIVKRDSAGYVLQVEVSGEIMSGEELRRELNLLSSNFDFSKTEEGLHIYCRGVGHGLGLSQYGACYLAEEGYSYIEILAHYYPNMELLEK